MNYDETVRVLRERGQEHLLRFWDELSEDERRSLLAQIEAVDWDAADLGRHAERVACAKEPKPIKGVSLTEIARDRKAFCAVGEKAIREGKLAAVLLAGGQGTRLGSDAPKGAFDIGITHPLYIFECLINNLRAVTERVGCFVPLFIMTSEKNDAETKAFFEEHGRFGYPREYIRFFKQDMAPAADFDGKLLLEEKGRLALSPNGNGGWYSSLARAGILEEFPAVEWLNVFSVDNVLQRIADPVFLGATILSGSACGAKVVSKAEPHEKVGVLCLDGGLPAVVEYYELPEEMANARDGEGKLLYRHGVILNYLFQTKKLAQIADQRIPVHIVKKKVPFLDGQGRLVRPEEVNAYKFETLILDMIRLMGSCLPFEVVREHEFAPVKSRTGVDSVESARELLQRNGVEL